MPVTRVHNTGTKLVMVLWPFVAEQRTEDESGRGIKAHQIHGQCGSNSTGDPLKLYQL